MRWLASNTSVENTSSSARGCSTVSPLPKALASRSRSRSMLSPLRPRSFEVESTSTFSASATSENSGDLKREVDAAVEIARHLHRGRRLRAQHRGLDFFVIRAEIGDEGGFQFAFQFGQIAIARPALRLRHHAPRLVIQTGHHGGRIGRMIGLLEMRIADRRRSGLFELIEIQAQIVDRHLGGLIGLHRTQLRGNAVAHVVGLQGRRFRGGRIREIHQLGFDGRLIARRHFARRRLVRAAFRRVQGEVEIGCRRASPAIRRSPPYRRLPWRTDDPSCCARPPGSPNKSMSTRFSPPSRFRSTSAPAPRPLPALLANKGSSGQICLPMMTILSHSPGGSTVARRFQSLRRLQERILVAPDEIDLQQLQPQVAPVRFALERNAHQVGRLIVQAIGHVEIGFGQRIALIEIDRALARHGVVGRLHVGVRIAQGVGHVAELRLPMLARFLDDEGIVALAHGAELGGRIAEIGDVGVLHPAEVARPLCRRRRAANSTRAKNATITATGTHQLAATQSIQDLTPRARRPASSVPRERGCVHRHRLAR